MEVEYEDTREVLQQKLAQMRKLVREAKHLVVYTGTRIYSIIINIFHAICSDYFAP